LADMTLCDNYLCQLKDECVRYNAIPDQIQQSYLANPRQECEEKDWQFYLEED